MAKTEALLERPPAADAAAPAPRRPGAADKPRLAKGARRRDEIIDHALACLVTKGYAETSMRDIATAAGINLGRLHYYFADRSELLLAALLRYKSSYLAAVEKLLQHDDPEAVREGFIAAHLSAATADGGLHRLWYDIKARALFNPTLEPVVDQIETALISIVSRLLTKLGRSADPAAVERTYAMLDAAFLWAITRSTRGDREIGPAFRKRYADALRVDTSIE